MSRKPSERRVVMARKIARDWLASRGEAEYRMRVYSNQDCTNYCNLLRAFRDGHRRIAKVDPIPDLGLRQDIGGFTVWSSDVTSLQSLKTFFESRGMDTSWIW